MSDLRFERPKSQSAYSGAPRLQGLDFLRGIAILMVLGGHAPLWNQSGRFQAFATLWHRVGWAGVDLFFVLSGFLIGGLLFDELIQHGKLDIVRFLIRRGFKIWPGYYLCVGIALALVVARTHGDLIRSVATMLPNLLHYQNYNQAQRPIEHTWSLAVEEHFYLTLPLGLWLLTNKSTDIRLALRPFPLIALVIMAFCLLFRCVINTQSPFSAHSHVFFTHIRIDSLVFGVLLAYIFRFAPDAWAFLTRHRALLVATGLGLISLVLAFERETTPFVWTIGYTFLYLGFGSLLIIAMANQSTKKSVPGESGLVGNGSVDASEASHLISKTFGADRFAAWVCNSRLAQLTGRIGFYSYAIYLWHGLFAERPIEALLRSRMLAMPSIRWLLANVLYVAGAVLMGVVMGRLIDRPFLAWRNRLYPARNISATDSKQSLR